ncbi:ankyrin repeat domain-containing protein sat10 [Purpureocillium lilacinum]|nr:ankyrin repeat domain-containing protein sat10 [Purpureocillium lilacinum]
MSYAAFRHGKVLQQVLGFFSLGKIRTFDVEDPTLKYWKVASQFALLPEVQSWREDSTDSRVLWVATPPMLDPTSLFSTLRSQIQQEDQFRPPVFIRVDATLYRHDELSEAQILSNMCAQMLRQQPQLASALQDLLLNVQDAAVGDHKLWQQRALWSCLRVLLYCPKDADTFCFIDATSSSHTKALAAELGPLLEASEMGLRLMVACRSARGQTPNVLTKYNVDLADEDFHEPLRQDLEEWIRESLEVGLPDASWQEALLMQMLSSGDFRLAHLALGFFASTPAWLTKWSINSIWTTLASQSTAESLIEDNIRRHGRWLLVPMLWALEAFEPNRIDEINVALKLNDGDVNGTVEDVINLLPGVLTTRGGALVIAEQVRPALEHLWSKYFAPTQSHAYLAE